MLRFQIHFTTPRKSYLDRIAIAYLSTMIHRDALWILKLRKEKVSKMTMKKSKTLHRFAAVAAVLLTFCLVFMMPVSAAWTADSSWGSNYDPAIEFTIADAGDLAQFAKMVNEG